MKNDPYHSWKAPCSFRVATEYIREFRTRRMPVLMRASRWLHGRNTVPSRSGTYGQGGGRDGSLCLHPCTPGRKIAQVSFFYHWYAGAPRITPDACPVSTRWCRSQHGWCQKQHGWSRSNDPGWSVLWSVNVWKVLVFKAKLCCVGPSYAELHRVRKRCPASNPSSTRVKEELHNRFNLISEERVKFFKHNSENLMKIGWKIRKLWHFEVLQIFKKHFLTSPYEYSNERVDDVMPSQFFICIVYEISKIFYFELILVKSYPHIKIYQSKHYFSFIVGGYKASFIFSLRKYEIFVISVYEINRKLWGDDIINSLIWIFTRTGQEVFSEKTWNFKMS